MSSVKSRIRKLEGTNEQRFRFEVLRAGMSQAEKDEFIQNHGPSERIVFIDTGVPRAGNEGPLS